jgi:hypothetical protein
MEETMQETSIQKLIQVKENESGYVAAIRVGGNRVRYAMADQQTVAVQLLINKIKG